MLNWNQKPDIMNSQMIELESLDIKISSFISRLNIKSKLLIKKQILKRQKVKKHIKNL